VDNHLLVKEVHRRDKTIIFLIYIPLTRQIQKGTGFGVTKHLGDGLLLQPEGRQMRPVPRPKEGGIWNPGIGPGSLWGEGWQPFLNYQPPGGMSSSRSLLRVALDVLLLLGGHGVPELAHRLALLSPSRSVAHASSCRLTVQGGSLGIRPPFILSRPSVLLSLLSLHLSVIVLAGARLPKASACTAFACTTALAIPGPLLLGVGVTFFSSWTPFFSPTSSPSDHPLSAFFSEPHYRLLSAQRGEPVICKGPDYGGRRNSPALARTNKRHLFAGVLDTNSYRT